MLVAALGSSRSASTPPATTSTTTTASTRPGRRPEAATMRPSTPIRTYFALMWGYCVVSPLSVYGPCE